MKCIRVENVWIPFLLWASLGCWAAEESRRSDFVEAPDTILIPAHVLDSAPRLRPTGPTAVAEGYERVAGVELLRDGLAVLDFYARTVRWLGDSGALTAEVGGPPEPISLGSAGGDSLYVFSRDAGRLLVVHPAGVADSSAAAWLRSADEVLARMADGSYLVSFVQKTRDRGEVGHDEIDLRMIAGDSTRSVGAFTGRPWYTLARGSRAPLPAGAERTVAADTGMIALGQPAGYAVAVLGPTAGPERLISVDLPARPVSACDRGRWDSLQLATTREEDREYNRQRLREIPSASEHAGFTSVHVLDGVIWARGPWPVCGRSQEWLLLDPAGRLLAVVESPVGRRLLDVSGDRAAFLVQRAPGEQAVEIWTIEGLPELLRPGG